MRPAAVPHIGSVPRPWGRGPAARGRARVGYPGGMARSEAPEDAYTAEPFVPGRGGLAALREAAAGCRGCPLHRDATQTVFGDGAADARVMLVGEQPGDQEDRQGRPFVGPAGKLLDRALEDAGIDPAEAYVTNAVKHFKFTRAEPRKRRIHKAPTLREMTACGPWLAAELAVVEPELIVVLGATAGKALLGSSFRVTQVRGTVLEEEIHGRPERLVPTVHPSSVLRADDRDAAYRGLLSDLKVAARVLG